MSENTPIWPIHEMRLVKKACTPDEPLQPDDTRRVNVESLQHGSGLLELRNALESEPENGYHFRCICGHRGSGKSTEVLGLAQWARENGYLPVRIVVNEYFGSATPNSTDLFWLMAIAAEEAAKEVHNPLPPDALSSVVKWFAEIVDEDKRESKSEIGVEASAQIGSSAFSLLQLFAKLSAAIKASSSHAETVRETLRKRPDALLNLTNEVLETANVHLGDSGYPQGLLVIFDNLDRLDPKDVRQQVLNSCQLIKQAKCHALFVIPIALAYDDEHRIDDDLDAPIVLPMLALRSRQSGWQSTIAQSLYDASAVELLVEVIQRRVSLDALFADPADANLLVRMSGGCLRDLMHLITRAADVREPGAKKLTRAAIERAITNQREDYRRAVPGPGWKLLATIRTGSFEIDTDLRNRLLHSRAALSYRASDGKVWYDVHPLLVETEEFQDAYRDAAKH